MASSTIHDLQADLADPRVTEAEDLVAAALRRTGWEVRDFRASQTYYDFLVRRDGVRDGNWQALDVKFDRQMDESDRIVFESHNEYDDGRRRDAWGRNINLNLLAVVGENLTYARIFDMAKFRELIAETEANLSVIPQRWRVVQARNRGYVTHGYAVPFDKLVAKQVHRFLLPLRPEDGGAA